MAEKLVAGMGTVKKAVQAIVVPGLNDLKIEVRVIATKQEEMEKRLDQKMDSGFLRIEQKIDSMAKHFDTQREIAILKAKVADLEKRK